jgi:hypothetical protein
MAVHGEQKGVECCPLEVLHYDNGHPATMVGAGLGKLTRRETKQISNMKERSSKMHSDC